jgi:synaptobrevin family protein YKT6
VPTIKNLLAQYSKPDQVDKLFKVQRDLDDTKEILLKSIDDLLERQEKLDDLITKTNDLSFQSKTLVKNSEKLNRCCTIL